MLCLVLGVLSHSKLNWGNNQNVKFNIRDCHLSLESLHLLKVFQIYHFRIVIIIHYKLNLKFPHHSQNAWGNHYCKMFFSLPETLCQQCKAIKQIMFVFYFMCICSPSCNELLYRTNVFHYDGIPGFTLKNAKFRLFI